MVRYQPLLSQHNKHTWVVVIRDHPFCFKTLDVLPVSLFGLTAVTCKWLPGCVPFRWEGHFPLGQYQRLWGKAKQNKTKQNFLELGSTKLTAMAKVLARRAGHAAWRSYSGGWEVFMPGLVGSGIHKAASHWLSKFGSPKLETVFENMSLSGKFYTVHKQRAIFVSL